jgi:CubicO group peptidase (beta-lactamase class C family)
MIATLFVATVAAASGPGDPAWDSLFATLRRDTLRDLKGVLVEQCGHALAEAYFNGDDATSLHDIRSATKSITSTLVGIAMDRGLIPSVDVSIATVLPLDRAVYGGITLRDLLTMRSGLDDDDEDSASIGNESKLDQSDDWLAFARRVPLKWPPGSRYVYSSLNAYLAGAVVERAAGVPLAAFAETTLFRPLGIDRYQWRRGPRGEGVGQGNLSITLRDMARIGELYLDHGARNGHRIVSARYVTDALAPLVPISASDPYADAYGYMWYSKSYDVNGDTVALHFASGNGGNKIYIVPRDHLIITITSSAYNTRYGQRRSEQILKRILMLVARPGQPLRGQGCS